MVVVRAATTPKTWPRSTPRLPTQRCIARAPLLGRSKPHSLLFLVRRMRCWQLAFCVSVFPSRRRYFVSVPSFYICRANHSAVSKPHPTEGADMHCCIQAAGILAATKCAVRCAHRSVLVVVHAACLCCWLFFFCCLDFSSFSNAHVILEK